MLILKKDRIFAFTFCLFFFLAYSVLSTIRYLHYQAEGFDLGIGDQIIWKYSQLKAPITTIQFYPFTSILTDHIEFIYLLIAPFYWIFNNAITYLILQNLAVTFSGMPIYLLAQKRKVHIWICYAILFSYLVFYGVQNALWFDAHSLPFGAAFLAWFIYFLDSGNTLWTWITFFLTIGCKEDMAFLTLVVSFVYFVSQRKKIAIGLMGASLTFLFLVFFIYFPYFTKDGYRYAGRGGLFSDLHLSYYYDTPEKRDTLWYSLAWFGFLPVLAPVFLLPSFGDITHYFLFGHRVTGAQGLFLHYRITLAPLLALPTILAVSKYKRLNTAFVSFYIVFCALVFQYLLHLPLSYPTKSWFWQTPGSVKNIIAVTTFLPANASVVAQDNIIPHIAHRDEIFLLWPEKKLFIKNSPCGQKVCNWFRWAGNPVYLLVDPSADWDVRTFLTDRESYRDGLINLEHAGVIKKYKRTEDAVLYTISYAHFLR